MDFDEASDILGGRLPVSPHTPSVWFDPGQITLLLGLALAVLFGWVRVAPHYRQWRETRYRKAMRRRHGIPDDDNRPFNVAYAAAAQARKRREGGNRAAVEGVLSPSLDRADERPRVGSASQSLQPLGVAGGLVGGYPRFDNGPGTSHPSRPEQTTLYPTLQQGTTTQPTLNSLSNGSSSRKHRQNGIKQPLTTRPLHGKHALDDEVDSGPETQSKKTRVEGEELIDRDEEAGWYGSNKGTDKDEVLPMKRGSKRVASTEDDEGLELSRADRHDKRARRISLDKSSQSLDQEMDDELEVDDADAENALRGKKRDRDEAGSTFGGDDSLDDEEKPQRRRRRRTTLNKLQGFSRGQKRGRDSNSPDSDLSDSELPRRESTRKKRGRKNHDEIVPVSNDPLCKGRHIGEEWESNGVLYKVGPNGQRLRQELIKKSRSRFPMPSDSQHPDRRAHVDVYVEAWLSEAEYQATKEHGELAWQDTPAISEPQTPGDVPDSPSKVGKNLLWSSTIASRESPIKRGVFRQSVATNIGLRLNVFPPPAVSSTRRISSAYQAPASPAADSPKMQKQKSYSKWEKQDLEAAAMSKLRDRQQATRTAERKSLPSTAPTSTSTPSLFNAPSSVAKAPEQPSVSTPTSFSLSPTATKSAATEVPKFTGTTSSPATAPPSNEPSEAPPPTFSFPATAAPPSTPSPAPASSQNSSSIPNFFAKPSIHSQSIAPSASTPKAFAPKSAAEGSATTAATATFSIKGQPAQSTGTKAPSLFGTPTNDVAKTEQPKAAPGASLASRLGLGPPPSSTSAPMFSFAKPAAATPSAPAVGSTEPAKAASGTPKFDFGLSSKPSLATTTPTPVATGTSASATAPKFSFGVNHSGSQSSASGVANSFGGSPNTTAPSSAPTRPVLSFGVPSGAPTATASPFGAAPNNGGKAPEVPKSAFSFGSNTSTASAPISSPFAGAATIGTASSAAAKPTEAPKSAFGFGAGNTSTPTPSIFGNSSQNETASKLDTQTNPTFSFGGPSMSTASSSTPAFGAPSSPAFGASSTSASSSTPAFGVPSTPFGAANAGGPFVSENQPSSSFFSNANVSSTTASASADTVLQTPTSTTQNKPTFSFNFGASSNNSSAPSAPTSAFGTTTTAPSPFGTPAFNQPGQSGSSTSSFGTPGAFSFGSGQNTQK